MIFLLIVMFLVISIAVAVSALVSTKESSLIMDRLEKVGATDILLFSITNSRM
jgi:ATP phosphoribosyltransferase